MSFRGSTFAIAFSLAAASGCTCGNIANPEGAICDTGGVCPSGYLCVGGVCHQTGGSGGGSGGGNTGVGGGTTGVGGGSGGATGGGSALCDGVVCNMPPAATCNGNMLRTFSGACNGGTGACDYSPMDTPCAQGCMNGQCVGNSCMNVTCTTPPAPACNGNNVITSSLPGDCKDGACRYMEATMSCPGSCANGACVPMGAAFSQVLPRVRHQVTAVDQRPGSSGDDVLVVGPAGAVSRWNGTQWSPVDAGMPGNLVAVWWAGTSNAYVVAENAMLRYSGGAFSRVTTFPAMTGNSRLVDLHGASDTNLAVVDNAGTIYRFASAAWTTTTRITNPPYRMNGVYMTPAGALRYYGQCGSPVGACVVFQSSSGSNFFDDEDSLAANFRAAGPALDLMGEAWLGLDIPAVRRHQPTSGNFDSINTPVGMDGGAVVAMTGSTGTTRATFVLTAPDKQLGHLYRVTQGLALTPTVDPLMDVLYGYQAMSKTESSGVIVVDMNTSTNTSTISRRGAIVNEVLDLGAEDWVAGAVYPNGSVLMNAYGDVALRANGQTTFGLRRFPFDLAATDIAAGSTYSVLTAEDGTAWRVSVGAAGGYTELTFTVKPASLSAVCRASDTEWYLAGKAGGLFGYDGTVTRTMASGTTSALVDLDCPAPGAAVACGTGVVLRLNGNAWVAVPNPPAGTLTHCALVQGVIYVAGPGVYARFQNGAWVTMPSRPTLDGLVVRGVNDAYAASGNTIHRFDGTGWTQVSTAPQALTTGFTMGTRVVFAGAGGTVLEGQ